VADLEIVVVPWEVDRPDSAAARAPRQLLSRGLAARLAAGGHRVHRTVATTRSRGGRAAVCAAVARAVRRTVGAACRRGRLPVVLSGGCLGGVGVVAALGEAATPPDVLWLDAHGDLHTRESSLSGYWDGMALAAVLGLALGDVFASLGLRPPTAAQVVHLGGRDFDPPEEEAFDRLGITRVAAQRLADGVTTLLLGERLGRRPLYLHLDLDGLDPCDAPSVSFPVPGGVRVADLVALLEALPRPAAVTLAAASFAATDEAGADRTLESCAALLLAALPRSAD